MAAAAYVSVAASVEGAAADLLEAPTSNGRRPHRPPPRAARGAANGAAACAAAAALAAVLALTVTIAALATLAVDHAGAALRSRALATAGGTEKAGWGVPRFAPPPSPERERCGHVVEEGVDYEAPLVAKLPNVGSSSMCCAACEGYAACGAWTWGKQPNTPWLTDTCWLKELDAGAAPTRVPKNSVVSGRPAPFVRKFGAEPPSPSRSEKLRGVTSRYVGDAVPAATTKCPGNLSIAGYGVVSLINAGHNVPGKSPGQVEVLLGDAVVPHMGGRSYFARACAEGPYDPRQYLGLNLLGKTLRWTADVSGTGCGCNAAFYLASMRQNTQASKCRDYYCDAMSVCGVPCGEIDLQEANQYSWFSTLHAFNPTHGADTLGVARGYGGSLGEPSRRDWTSAEYGPGSRCIDTTKPFSVAAAFILAADSSLAAVVTTLSQAGCSLQARADGYSLEGHAPMAELTEALRQGMTPIVSYWKSKDMLWMDGLGADGRGPCVKDAPDWCPAYARFYGFSVEDIQTTVQSREAAAPPAAAPPTAAPLAAWPRAPAP